MSENLVLSGPIVRRVDASSVSVFVATRKPCDVTLTIFEEKAGASGAQMMQAMRHTIALGTGQGAHAVVVTARAPNALQWGGSYHYDLSFKIAGLTLPLFADGVVAPTAKAAKDVLVYPGHIRPGFVLPPKDPGKLRILHGSCRKPHGDGEDALPRADALIREAIQSPTQALRPHQLFLTGDQIYADDVLPELLTHVRAFAQRAIGTEEETQELQGFSNQLAPGNREVLVQTQAKLSSSSCSSHLISLAEFYAMYLFAWSLEPWPDGTPPKTLASFANGLPAVRRALANIATYMIFDDHEVTDDWYLNGTWATSVLGAPLGRRILRNGLAAYAVFQHWGNDPDQFAANQPGGKVLALLDRWDGRGDATALERLLPVPSNGSLLASPAPTCVDWSWRWVGPSYEVIALDTRTKREFVGAKTSLLSTTHIEEALEHKDPSSRFTILISAAPILGVRLLEWMQRMAIHLSLGLKVDAESWSQGPSFQHLIPRLLKHSPVLVLSGDVHFGFGSSLFDKKTPEIRIVNLVSSSLKNSSGRWALRALELLSGSDGDFLKSLQERSLQDRMMRPSAAPAFDLGALLLPEEQLELATAGTINVGDLPFSEELEIDAESLVMVDEAAELQFDAILKSLHKQNRTKLNGRCNLGEVRFVPDKNQLVHTLWSHTQSESINATFHLAPAPT
jgi:hypothetical protein